EKPKDASVMSQAASFYSSTGDMDQALTLIEKAVQIDPNNIGYLQTQANFYVRANKMDKAEAAYKAILQNAKEAWLKDWANGELLNIYQKQNKLGDVIKTYEADLNNSGNDISAYKKLGELYIRKGDGAKALEVYEKASEIAPDDRVITNRLVDMYDMNNKPAEAAALVEKLFKANPNETYLQERLAGLYDRAGKKEDAKRIWQGLLVQSKDAMMFSRYAELLYRSGDAEGAMAQLKKAEELDPNNPSFSMRRGQMLLDGGKKDEAKAVFAKVASSAKDEWAKNDAKRRVDDIEAMGKAPKVTEVRPSVPAVEVKGEPGKPVPVVASPAAPVAVSPAAPAAAVSPAAPAAAAGPAAPAPAASQPPAADTKK
ncbi:MAG: tetratricopeptide repeat protein, partial [Candidatus Omnitrophica bacterium]|nr:tetratricopeptide repeat protein [Candidatus Omnitrophota bacterium]